MPTIDFDEKYCFCTPAENVGSIRVCPRERGKVSTGECGVTLMYGYIGGVLEVTENKEPAECAGSIQLLPGERGEFYNKTNYRTYSSASSLIAELMST